MKSVPVIQIIRTYNPSEDSPLKCRDLAANEIVDVNIAQLFPVLFLSQTEIIKIAEDQNEQMKFIDKFFDFHKYRNQIINIETELENLNRKFAESLRAYHEGKILNKQLQTLKVELERLSKQLKNPIFSDFAQLENKDKVFRVQYAFLKSTIEHVDGFEKTIKDGETPKLPKELSDDPALRRTQDYLKSTIFFLLDNFTVQREKLNEIDQKIVAEYKIWKPTFDEKKTKYQDEVLKLGGDFQKLEEKRKTKTKEIENLEHKLLSMRSKAKQIKEIYGIRKIYVQSGMICVLS